VSKKKEKKKNEKFIVTVAYAGWL